MKARLFGIALVFSVFFLASVTALYLPVNRERAEMLRSPCLAKPWLCRFLHDPPPQYVNAPAISSPANASYGNSSQPLSLEFVATGSFSGYSVQVFVDGSLTESGAISNNSLYSRALPVLSPGSHAVEVRASNGSKTNSSSVVFSIDEPPAPSHWVSVSITNPVNGSRLDYSSPPRTIYGRVVGYSSTYYLFYVINGTNYYAGTASNDSIFSIGIPLLGNGSHSVTVMADAGYFRGSAEVSFEIGDFTPPTISNVSFSSSSDGTFGWLSFATDEPAAATVSYRPRSSMSTRVATNSSRVFERSLRLDGLIAGTEYAASVYAIDSSSNVGSATFYFTPRRTPSFYGISAKTGPWSAAIEWSTDFASDAVVELATGEGTLFFSNATSSVFHRVFVDGLKPGVVYSYRVSSTGAANTSEWLSLVTPPLQEGWSSFHGGWNKTGYSFSFVPDNVSWAPVKEVMVAWTHDTDLDIASSPVIVDGVVYFGSNDGKVRAVNGRSGGLNWLFDSGSHVWSTPAVAGGNVFFGTEGGAFYSLNARTGLSNWVVGFTSPIFSSPVVSGERVFVVTRSGYVTALNASSGLTLWSTRIWDISAVSGLSEHSPWIDGSPLVAYGKVFVGSYDNNLYALDELTGEVEWRFATGSWVRSTPAADSSGCVLDCPIFFGSDDHFVRRVASSSGVEQWRFDARERVVSSPAVSSGLVFFGSYDGNVYAVNKNTGVISWTFSTGGWVESSPAVASGIVFIGSNDNYFYAFDEWAGSLKWKYLTRSWVKSSPAISDGLVVVGSLDFRLYAFGGLTECRTLLSNGPSSEKADVVFISDNYVDSMRESFFSDASFIASGDGALLDVEPLRPNAAKFNVYALYTGGSGYVGNAGNPRVRELIREKCLPLGGALAELAVDLFNYDDLPGSAGCDTGGGNGVCLITRFEDRALSSSDVKHVFIHEFGHTYLGGSQEDEYLYNVAGSSPYGENADYEGCAKWCSGVMNLSVAIPGDSSGKTCYRYYSDFKSCIAGGGSVTACWTPYYSTVVDNCNFGVGCRPGTGCYWGAWDMLLFRSTAWSVMRYYGNAYFSLVQRELLLAALANFTPAATGYVIPYCGNKASSLPCVDWTAGVNFREGQVLVEFNAGVLLADATAVINAANASVLDSSRWAAQRRLVASVVRGSEAKLSWLLEKDSRVAFAEPNR